MCELPLSIRDFRKEDFESLYAIDQVCFAAHIAYTRAEFVFYLSHSKSITRVAEAFGRVVGFALARIEKRSTAHVITLDVVPEFWRRGIGEKLLHQLHSELERRKVLFSILEVGVDNLPARMLYEKLRYKYVERLVGYYQGTEDAYRMARSLSRSDR